MKGNHMTQSITTHAAMCTLSKDVYESISRCNISLHTKYFAAFHTEEIILVHAYGFIE